MDASASYRIIPELKLIVNVFSGSIMMNEIIDLNQKYIKDNLYNPTFNILNDFSDSIAIGFKMDLDDFWNFFKQEIKLTQRIKVGFILSTPNQRYLLALYKPIANLMKMDVGQFSNFDNYYKWMKFSDEDNQIIQSAIDSLKIIA